MRPFNILLSLLLSWSPAYGQRRFTSHNFNIQGGTGVGQGVGVGSNGGVGVGTGVGIGGNANVQIVVDGNGGVKVRPNDACGGSDWILDQSTNTCYKIFASDMTWETAEQQCKSLTDGKGQSTLAVIKSSNEHEFIVKSLLSQFVCVSSGGYRANGCSFWIGYKHNKWVDGSQVSYTNWIPRNWNQGCAAVQDVPSYLWFNGDCNSYRPALCQKKVSPSASPSGGQRTGGDPCTNYQVLDDRTRSVHNGWVHNCDKFGRSDTSPDWKGAGWYKFEHAGNKLAQSSPGKRKCGTDKPGWTTSSIQHMHQGETRDIQICFHSFDDPCGHREQGKVKNCGSFIVYYLPDIAMCDLRYCAAF